MKYLSVSEIAKKWKLSDSLLEIIVPKVKFNGAFLTGKTWNIPEKCS
ncbi:MAG: hypothetical protein PHC47_03665 [Clostridia bacterium]|jgi:hypothetical protein|nr:hypothetical protein [Clostridia bacterium]